MKRGMTAEEKAFRSWMGDQAAFDTLRKGQRRLRALVRAVRTDERERCAEIGYRTVFKWDGTLEAEKERNEIAEGVAAAIMEGK